MKKLKHLDFHFWIPAMMLILLFVLTPIGFYTVHIYTNIRLAISSESDRTYKENKENYEMNCQEPYSEYNKKYTAFGNKWRSPSLEAFKMVKADRSLSKEADIFKDALALVEEQEALDIMCSEVEKESASYTPPTTWVYFQANWKELMW